jgi:hypothetical protein
MAIKGKRKSRGKPRTVAAPPRPFLVRPKTPLFRRRPVQVVVLLIVFGLVAALGWGLRSRQDAAQLRLSVSRFGSSAEATLSATGVATPFGGSWLVLPDLGGAVSQLGGGNGKALDQAVRNVRENGDSWATSATQAADAIAAIETEDADLKQSRNLMEQGLRLYASMADEIQVAAAIDTDARKHLLSAIQQQLAAAAGVFDTGWGLLTQRRAEAGIPVLNQPPGLPPGVPGAPQIPGLPPGQGP